MTYLVKKTSQFKRSYKLAVKRGLNVSLLELETSPRANIRAVTQPARGASPQITASGPADGRGPFCREKRFCPPLKLPEISIIIGY